MEALAALQLQKKKAQRELDRKKEELENVAAPQSMQERNALNRILGFPDPPEQVFALAKDESAAVWWTATGDDTIASWQVQRFRRDRSRPTEDVWHAKGTSTYELTGSSKNQVLVFDLSNDWEYRFEVAAINAKGSGVMSDPSNGVMVEKPLPAGWYRFYNTSHNRHYYANVRLNLSSWARPELDPWFLDEALQLNFHKRELEALKALYKEELAHFGCVSVEQFIDVLRECGERASKSWVTKLFRGYSGSGVSVKQWRHFMEVVNHIKKRSQMGVLKVANPFEKVMTFIRRLGLSSLLRPTDKGAHGKLGDWTVEYSALAEKSYYLNSKTGESLWSMPPQVMFYIPPKLEDKLLQVFDFGDLEEFQQYFSMLDIDNSGDLSPNEIRILLKTLHLEINEKKFKRLIRTVDLNGNGTIEFDEYCWMMLQIYKKDNTGIFGELQKQHGHKQGGHQLERQNSLQDSVKDSVKEVAQDLSFKEAGLDLSYRNMREGLDSMKAEQNRQLSVLSVLSVSKASVGRTSSALPLSPLSTTSLVQKKRGLWRYVCCCCCCGSGKQGPGGAQKGGAAGIGQSDVSKLNSLLSTFEEDDGSLVSGGRRGNNRQIVPSVADSSLNGSSVGRSKSRQKKQGDHWERGRDSSYSASEFNDSFQKDSSKSNASEDQHDKYCMCGCRRF